MERIRKIKRIIWKNERKGNCGEIKIRNLRKWFKEERNGKRKVAIILLSIIISEKFIDFAKIKFWKNDLSRKTD